MVFNASKEIETRPNKEAGDSGHVRELEQHANVSCANLKLHASVPVHVVAILVI
jgi:hypothetical protein